jgi:hypothetical protein
MDSENISQLINKYSLGLTSPDEETMLLDYLKNNPSAISEEGYDVLVDKLVYEHSLLQRKALFQEMMKNPPSSFLKTYFLPILISGVLLISGGVFIGIHNSKLIAPATKNATNPENKNLNSQPIPSRDSVINKQILSNNKSVLVPKSEIISAVSKSDTIIGNSQNKQIATVSAQKPISTLYTREPVTVSKNAAPASTNSATNKEIAKQSAPLNVCPDYTKAVKVTATKSQINQNNGAIQIISKNAMLEYSVDNEIFTVEKSFGNLLPGKYNLYIRDNANCLNTISGILIEETACYSAYKNDLAKGDTWQIPISVANVKSIVIYNTSGQIVYKQSQPFPSNFEWKGTNIQGMELSEGLYKVVVTYQKESCIFNVSILN